jgi:hypothetical protein
VGHAASNVTRTIDVDAESGWTAIKDNRQFSIRVAIDPSTGCLDILREITPGEKGGLYMRILPRPGGGSVVVATIPIVPTSSPERTSSILADELDRIAMLVTGPGRANPGGARGLTESARRVPTTIDRLQIGPEEIRRSVFSLSIEKAAP